MSISFPETEQDILDRVLADVQNELPETGPFLKNNFVYAQCAAYSARIFDNYQLVKEVIKQMFPDTATDEYLERWGGYIDVTKLFSTKSVGKVTASGLTGSNIAINTVYQTTTGKRYKTTSPGTIAQQTFAISSLTRSGNIATVNTSGEHQLATGMLANIYGADQTEYNGEFTVTVTGLTQFIYTITGTPTTPATGSNKNVTFAGVQLSLEAEDAGHDGNLDSGTQLSLVTPLVGVDTFAYVQYSKIAGGADQEADDRYRDRVIYEYQNPVALFNESAIVSNLRRNNFVDRVFVQAITPHVGQVTVYFTKLGVNIIPSSEDVNIVKANLMKIAPANTDPVDVYVLAPVPVVQNFTIQNMVPNTVTMQNAVKESLRVIFQEATEVGVNFPESAYRSAIYQTVDLETGDIVNRFTMTNPTTDISVASGQLATLGSVSFI